MGYSHHRRVKTLHGEESHTTVLGAEFIDISFNGQEHFKTEKTWVNWLELTRSEMRFSEIMIAL